jgi:hypothetical protein
MDESTLKYPPDAPAGLKFARGFRTRFWLRPDSMSFRRLYAVHFAPMDDAVDRNAFVVSGYLGSFEFNWHASLHACKLLVAHSGVRNSLETFGSLVDQGCGEWLLCNAKDADDAKGCEDSGYVAQRCHYDSAVKGLSGVYFVSNGRGSVKVGNSVSGIGQRFMTLQTATPDRLRVVAVIAHPDPRILEARLHQMLSSKQIRGEWFEMTDEEAVAIAVKNGGRPLSSVSVDTK